jgi:type 1 fimbria pilin
MRRIATFAAVLAISMLGFAPAASAAGELCYDVDANVNGTVVDESGCIPF